MSQITEAKLFEWLGRLYAQSTAYNDELELANKQVGYARKDAEAIRAELDEQRREVEIRNTMIDTLDDLLQEKLES